MAEASEIAPGQRIPDFDSRNIPRGPLASDISNAVVHLFSEYLGRGPTRVRTVITPNLISVVMEDTLTKAERKLIERGEEQLVIQTRRITQQMMRSDLVNQVESLSGRRVIAFLSDHQADPDFAIENFVLEPLAEVAADDSP
jgi:uncharacterized protein YbcI